MMPELPVSIVTGSTSGIGRAIAIAFAEAGYRVVVNGRDPDHTEAVADELRSQGRQAIGVAGDVTDAKTAEALVTAYERVDVLINNAGISPRHNGKRAPAVDVSEEEWQRVIDVNLTAAWRISRTAARVMIKQEEGVIIFIASLVSRTYVGFTGCHYQASKAGMVGLAHALAGELAPHGIRVCSIAPGRIATPMATTVNASENERFLESVPLRVAGEPMDVANAALFLASSKAKYITGATLDVNGGVWMS